MTSPGANGEVYSTSAAADGKALQDRIANLISGGAAPRGPTSSSRPSSRVSNRSVSVADHNVDLEKLQIRLDYLESENKKLRDASELAKVNEKSTAALLVDVKSERDTALGRTYSFEAQLKTLQRAVSDRESKIEVLERAVQDASRELERHQTDSDSRYKDLQSQLEDSQTRVSNLKHAMEVQQGLENRSDAIVKAKNDEIALLESRIQKLSEDAEFERRTLGEHIDELRHAGQVTIASFLLYHITNFFEIGNHCAV